MTETQVSLSRPFLKFLGSIRRGDEAVAGELVSLERGVITPGEAVDRLSSKGLDRDVIALLRLVAKKDPNVLQVLDEIKKSSPTKVGEFAEELLRIIRETIEMVQ